MCAHEASTEGIRGAPLHNQAASIHTTETHETAQVVNDLSERAREHRFQTAHKLTQLNVDRSITRCSPPKSQYSLHRQVTRFYKS